MTAATDQMRKVATVIPEITNRRKGNTFPVGTFEFVKHTSFWSGCTNCHIVFVAGVFAVGDLVAHLVLGNTLPVTTLELLHFVAGEVFAQLCGLISAVTTIINFITEVAVSNTQMVFALEFVVWAIFAIRVSGGTVQLV